VRRVRKLSMLSAAAAFALAALAACHPKPHDRVSVAVSVFPLDDLVRRIAGPDADVALVLPPGASAPPADASARVAHANLLVGVGLGVDPWMDPLLPAAAPKAHLLKLGDRVPTISEADGTIDGSVWLDPQRARLMATAIAEDLARADSSHAIAFRTRASALDASLAALDQELETRTAAWPNHELVAPPSMAYFAERYGLHPAPGANGPEAARAVASAAAKATTYEDLLRNEAAAVEPPRP
jgi:zinc transport system substrate-binding protein